MCFIKMLSNPVVYFFMLITGISSCTPTDLESIEDYDLVYTVQEKGYNFASVKTYFLPDSVVHITGDNQIPDHTFDDKILQKVKSNLQQLGWTQLLETGTEKADIIVLATVSKRAYGSCASWCWYCDWGWYPGWGFYPPVWGPGWNWGYPTDIICTSYSTGTLFVSIVEPDQPRGETLPVVWTGILNGLLEGSDDNINSRIAKNIDQMFIQSPYLGAR